MNQVHTPDTFDGSDYACLKAHVGHEIEVVTYGDQNVSVECLDCCEVLYSVEKMTRLERIQEAISDEYEAYRRAMCTMPAADVFRQSGRIHLVEEITFLVRDCPHELEGDEPVVALLERLCVGGRFLSEFLAWADDNDSNALS